MERSPAVAGSFYPADADSLRQSIQGYLGEAAGEPARALALVVPHAGYIYSGRTAGRTYAATRIPDRVVILGPNHTGRGRPAAVWKSGRWLTPLGEVPVDEETAGLLVEKAAILEADTGAHAHEHSLEVQVPFLRYLNRDVRIVPICLADVGLAKLVELGETLADVLDRRPGESLVVISSDMTHYESRETARRQDRLALDRIEALDVAGLYRVVHEEHISMCGFVPAVAGLAAAVRRGATVARLVDYSCSGDVTGDDSQVVAYAGLSVT